jgi:hypothetical protein
MKVRFGIATVLLVACSLWLGSFEKIVRAQTSTPSAESEVSVADANGYGSTGVYARTFATSIASVGGSITYTSDSVNGDYFTINNNGVYAISYSDGNPNVWNAGVSLNFAATSAWSTVWGTGKELCNFTLSNSGGSCSATVLLASGDVLRAHRDSNAAGANSQTEARFIVVRVR